MKDVEGMSLSEWADHCEGMVRRLHAEEQARVQMNRLYPERDVFRKHRWRLAEEADRWTENMGTDDPVERAVLWERLYKCGPRRAFG